jgi:hypothetical protein
MSSGVAFTPDSTQAANSQGSRSPSKMAWMMFMPLTPLMSLNTLLSCTFISVNIFCMRWTVLAASGHQIAPVPPQGAGNPDLIGGLETVIQQTKSV